MCFLALGGVFAEIMTGNLMFAAFALGQGRFSVDFVQFAIPLACFTVGAVLGAALGAFLVRFGAGVGLLAAASVYLVALVWLLRGKSPSAATS